MPRDGSFSQALSHITSKYLSNIQHIFSIYVEVVLVSSLRYMHSCSKHTHLGTTAHGSESISEKYVTSCLYLLKDQYIILWAYHKQFCLESIVHNYASGKKTNKSPG